MNKNLINRQKPFTDTKIPISNPIPKLNIINKALLQDNNNISNDSDKVESVSISIKSSKQVDSISPTPKINQNYLPNPKINLLNQKVDKEDDEDEEDSTIINFSSYSDDDNIKKETQNDFDKDDIPLTLSDRNEDEISPCTRLKPSEKINKNLLYNCDNNIIRSIKEDENDDIDDEDELSNKKNDELETNSNLFINIEKNSYNQSRISEEFIESSQSNMNININEKDEQYEEKLEIKQICVNVFLYYSSFSLEEKDFIITQLNLNKLLKELNIISDSSYLNNGNINNNNLLNNENININTAKKMKKSKSSIDINGTGKNYNIINKNNYANLKLPELKIYDVDILIKKANNKGKIMNLNQFLNFIVLLSDKLYHGIFKRFPSQALEKLVENYFLPFYYYLINPQTKVKENSLFSINQLVTRKVKQIVFEDNSFLIFNDIYKTLKWIYTFYFKEEIKNNMNNNVEKIIKNSLDDLILFCKEFGIYPYNFELNKIVIIFHIIIELRPIEITKLSINDGDIYDSKKNIGKILTLSKFAMILYFICIFIYDKFNQSMNSQISNDQINAMSNSEKLILFLDKLNQSDGFGNLHKKFNYLANQKLSFIPSLETIDNIYKYMITNNNEGTSNLNNSNNFAEGNFEGSNNKNLVDNSCNKINALLNNLNFEYDNDYYIDECSNYMNYLNNNFPEIFKRYKKYLCEIKNIFDDFSSVGEKLIKHKMNITGFIRCMYFFNLIGDKNKVIAIPNMNNARNNSVKSIKQNNYLNKNKGNNLVLFSKKENNKDGCKTGNKNYNITKYYIKENDAYIIFNEIKDKNQKFISFEEFLISFEHIANKLIVNKYFNNKEKLIKFFDEYLLVKLVEKKNTNNKLENIVEILSNLKETKIFLILNDISKNLYSIYQNYVDSNEFLNFNKFFQLIKDLTIFPDIVNLLQLKSMFYPISELFKVQLIQEIKSSEDFNIKYKDYNSEKIYNFFNDNLINFEHFCHILAISSFYIKDNQCNPNQKFFKLLQKITHSKLFNINKNPNINYNSLKELNSNLEMIKNKYLGEEYTNQSAEENYYKQLIKSPNCFDEIC